MFTSSVATNCTEVTSVYHLVPNPVFLLSTRGSEMKKYVWLDVDPVCLASDLLLGVDHSQFFSY